MPKLLPLLVLLWLATPLRAQDPPAQQKQPQVRVNVLNVCAPNDQEKQAIAGALAAIPLKPAFAPDFEISRGRSTAPDTPVANWVRVRREFPPGSTFSSAHYSMSADENSIIETFVFRMREPKDILQVTLDDRISMPVTPATVVGANTPARRIKVERFGQSSLGLSRCPETDQAAYEPLFRTATQIMARYRDALDVRRTVPADMARLGVRSTPVSKPAAGNPAAAQPKPPASKP